MRDTSIALVVLAASACVQAGAADDKLSAALKEGKKRFENNCGVCHSLSIPRSQHLNRSNWEWVMDDMVNKYGANWLTEKDQELILDYLVAQHGPQR